MRKSLWIVLALLVVGAAQVARADTTESFNFSGTLAQAFGGNDSITGTFTLDLTKGTITAFDFTTPLITVDASNGYVAELFTYTPAVNPNTDFVQLFFGHEALNVVDYLNLQFQTDLASFSGNTFYTSTVEVPPFDGVTTSSFVCGQPPYSTACTQKANSFFTSGSATPVTAPEPASLLLLGSGLLGLAGIKQRRSGC